MLNRLTAESRNRFMMDFGWVQRIDIIEASNIHISKRPNESNKQLNQLWQLKQL